MSEIDLDAMLGRAENGIDLGWGHYHDDVNALVAEVRRLRAKLDAVRALHNARPHSFVPDLLVCDFCEGETAPCQTARILDGAE